MSLTVVLILIRFCDFKDLQDIIPNENPIPIYVVAIFEML